MRKQVLQIAARVPVATSELSGALYDIRSAGISAKDAMGVLENSAKLAVAGLGTVQEASDLATSAINAFKLTGKDQEKLFDNIFKTVRAGKTTISQLAQGFGAVASTVANANVKLDEYLSAVAALTTTGLPAAQAHAQLRAAIAGLTRETPETTKLFEQLGARTFKELIANSGGLVGAFKRIVDALQGNDAMLIKVLGSVEAFNAVVNLATASNKTFTETLDGMRNGADQLDAAFEKQKATVSASLQLLANAANRLAISFGEGLAPAVTAIASVLTGLASALSSLPGPVQTAIAVILTLAAAIGPATYAFGLLTGGFFRLVGLLPLFASGLATAAPLLAAAANGVRLLTGAIAALAAGTGIWGIALAAIIGYLAVILSRMSADDWKAFGDEVLGVWSRIEDAVASAAQAIGDSIGYVDQQIAGAIDWFRQWLDYAQRVAQAMLGFGGGGDQVPTQARAGGGPVFGPGTSTSDSVLIRASRGEYVVRAAAVRRYGVAMFEALNRMRVPLSRIGYASGGIVDGISQALGGALASPIVMPQAVAAGAGSARVLNLTIGAETFTGLRGDDDTMDRLTRFAVRQQLRSPGRKPGWSR